MTVTAPEDDELDRRAAATALARELRALIDDVVSSEAPESQLLAALTDITHARQVLADHRRGAHQMSSFDGGLTDHRFYATATGPGNPLSTAASLQRSAEGVAIDVKLGRAYEGPPGHVHGGVIALVFDELLGRAAIDADRYGMTARLEIRYRKATPLHADLRFRARVHQVEGRRTIVHGWLCRVDDPDVVLVEAEALFIDPGAEKRQAYFARMERFSGGSLADYRPGSTS